VKSTTRFLWPAVTLLLLGIFRGGPPPSSAQSDISPIGPIRRCRVDSDCEDGDPCTRDTCLRTACVRVGACDDGNPCTDDACRPCDIRDILCIRSPHPYRCTNTAVGRGTSCDDDFFCDGHESCSGDVCVSGDPPCRSEQDGDQDCREACDEANDRCDAPEPKGTPCNDQLACTRTDACNENGECVGGDEVVCEAPDQCHAPGVCDNESGGCISPPTPDEPCSADGSLGICDAEGRCLPTTSVCGTPEQQCTDGECCAFTCRLKLAARCGGDPPPCHEPRRCDGASAACPASDERVADGRPCDDGDICNGADSCLAGACTQHSPRAAGTPCRAATGPGVCNGAGVCVPSVCGNAQLESGEECDGGECCTGSCLFKGPTEPCGAEIRSCHEQPLCNGREATCPAVPRLAAEGSACSDGNGCTVEDTCRQGECVPGQPICAAVAESPRKPRPPGKVRVKVACESKDAARCEAMLVLDVVLDGTATGEEQAAVPGTLARPADDGTEIVISKPVKRKTTRKKRSALGFRTVLTLRLNKTGRKLLRSNDVTARAAVVVVRNADSQEFLPVLGRVTLQKWKAGRRGVATSSRRRTNGVFAPRAHQPSARRVYQPAALP
jgi:hypothetical protein